MSSNESRAYEIMQDLGVDYVLGNFLVASVFTCIGLWLGRRPDQTHLLHHFSLFIVIIVIFGGLIGYSGDDINKFLWMVRIAQGLFVVLLANLE